MITFDSSTLRVLAGLLLVMVGAVLVAYVRRRRRVARELGDASVLRDLIGSDLRRLPWSRLLMIGMAGAAISLALLDPGLGAPPSGREGPVVLLMDVSGSMLVEDVGTRRIDLERELAAGFVRSVPDRSVGVVAFAGRAFALTPPTRDRVAVDMYLSTLDPSIVTQSGSALGAAIRQGVSLLTTNDSGGGGTIILFSDGDETEERAAAEEAAALAGRRGVALHVVGVGTEEGGPVPALDLSTGEVNGYLRDGAGGPLQSRLDADLLRLLARRSAGGTYVSGASPDAVGQLAAALEAGGASPRAPGDPLPPYAWFSLAALVLLALEPITHRMESRR